MPDPAAPAPYPQKRQKGPNFLLVVVLSGVAFMLFFAGALLIMHHYARYLLPHRQHQQRVYLRIDPGAPQQSHALSVLA